MTIYNDYYYEVKAIHPSGLVSFESGKAKSTRRFKVPCEYSEDFALRQIGKLYIPGDTASLPAPFPFSGSNKPYGQMHLVASSFNIEPLCVGCFNVRYETEDSDTPPIEDPVSQYQMERYWHRYPDGLDDSECSCIVTIGYEENPCDCASWDEEAEEWVVAAGILPNTCISSERNPSYELFTLPNAPLVWSDLPPGENRRLKSDSYAYKVIPKADIIVSWHNVPVNKLGQIETHLREFRGKVNEHDFGEDLFCDYVSSSESPGVIPYEPETIMFIDFQEDRSKRTDAFGGMRVGFSQADNTNTTTLKLNFKQKRITQVSGSGSGSSEEIVGWNYLFRDTDSGTSGVWARVQVEATSEDLFELKDFTTILYPPVL